MAAGRYLCVSVRRKRGIKEVVDYKEMKEDIEKVIDPVCGMTVSPDTAAGEYEYRGVKFFFCSKSCFEKFEGDLRGLVRARHLSHATMRNNRQNLFFAFAYNLLGVPIATGILYSFFGILLSPMIASAAMSFSSVSVIGNALRLRNVKL